jgi:molybdopterin synthase catalytic subunit
LFIHRLGWVPVGEASLFVRVLSAHRGEALRFLAEAINRLKTDVPIWKRA